MAVVQLAGNYVDWTFFAAFEKDGIHAITDSTTPKFNKRPKGWRVDTYVAPIATDATNFAE